MRVRNASILVTLCLAACGSSGGSGSSGAVPATNSNINPAITPSFEPLELTTIDRGDNSNMVTRSPHNDLVTEDMAWINLWQAHSSTKVPTVDFGLNSVVGSFLEQLSNGGNSTEVVGVVQDVNSGDLVATIRDSRAAPFQPQIAITTTPFHIVSAAFKTPVTTMTVRQQSDLKFETVTSGSRSNIGFNNPNAGESFHVARNQAELDAFWQLHSPGTTPPTFDFNISMMVAVLGGSNPNFGNTVRTKRIVHDRSTDTIRVIHEVDPYRGGAAPPIILTPETPFQILRVVLSSGSARAEALSNASFTSIASGNSTLNPGNEGLTIIRDAATFDAIWTSKIGTAVPVVDFSTTQVVAYFANVTRVNISSRIARISITEDGELLTRVETNSFGGGPSSYSIVTMPKTFSPARLELFDVTPRP
ncbi:MAG: hypothetical protein P1V97_31375 [Planctomycetota bacterium]|nr:hypothetical protein [Planctomycetota bacterium]